MRTFQEKALIALSSLVLSGCTTPYIAVKECTVTKPPATKAYLEGNDGVRLVMMADAYIRQVESVNRCNAAIRLRNASNKALSP